MASFAGVPPKRPKKKRPPRSSSESSESSESPKRMRSLFGQSIGSVPDISPPASRKPLFIYKSPPASQRLPAPQTPPASQRLPVPQTPPASQRLPAPQAQGSQGLPVPSTPGGESKTNAMVFDFDGVLSPLGVVSSRRKLKEEQIERLLNPYKNELKSIKEELDLVKDRFDLYICSQNYIENIEKVCNKYYVGVFKGIYAKMSLEQGDIDKAVVVKSIPRVKYFIDDSENEVANVAKILGDNAIKITKWENKDDDWESKYQKVNVISELERILAQPATVSIATVNLRF